MTTTSYTASAETGDLTPPIHVRPRAILRRHWLFLAAAAAVMLHVADDNFLQPNPGVSPSDHLVSGLVPLGPPRRSAPGRTHRVRPGTRALIAFATGLTGLSSVGLVEPVSHLGNVGLRNDDYTAIPAAVAGVRARGYCPPSACGARVDSTTAGPAGMSAGPSRASSPRWS